MQNIKDFEDLIFQKKSVEEIIESIQQEYGNTFSPRFKEFVRDPDSLQFWEYDSNAEDWEVGMGSYGYMATDSKGDIIRSFVVRMN